MVTFTLSPSGAEVEATESFSPIFKYILSTSTHGSRCQAGVVGRRQPSYIVTTGTNHVKAYYFHTGTVCQDVLILPLGV